MAWTETLPSGKYRGGYRLPTGQKRRVPGSFDTKRRALAEAVTAEEAAARPGWKDPKAAARTWGEWNAEWWPTRGVSAVTAKNEGSMLKRIEKRWGDVALAEIDREAVRRWTHAMSKELAPTSVNRILAVFRASLGAAVDAEVLVTNPATKAGVSEGDRERRFLTRDQASDLIDALTSDRDKAMVTFMFGTGVRFGEAAGLQLPRLASDLSKVEIIETWLINAKKLSPYPKSRKFRTVPVPRHVAKTLEPIVQERSSGFAFPGDRSPAVSHSSFLTRFGNAAEDAGVKDATPHATRHSYASWLLEAGVPMVRVSRLLGHRNTKVTDEIYGHISTESGDSIDDALGWK